MKYKDWIKLNIDKNDILLRCTDPSGLDKDHPIYPIGCARCFDNYFKTNSCKKFTNHPQINSQLLFFSFKPDTDKQRNIINQLSNIQNINNKCNNTNSRSNYYKNLSKNFKTTPLNTNDYFDNIGKYKFIISPTGNGLDCHRHYEAWISKGIPIIDYHPFLEKKFRGLPVLWTNNYQEITPSYLNDMYTKFLEKEFDFRKLLFKYYKPEFQKEILIIRKNQNNTNAVGVRNKQFWTFSDYFSLN